jgi:lambda family phage portal protein
MRALDRLIGVFSPRRELGRIQARSAIAMLDAAAARSYEGATAPRRGWSGVRRSSANAALRPDLVTLRDRARDMVRNTPMARVPDVLASHIVGTGIMPVSRTGNRALDKRVNKLFEEWQQDALVSGELDFYGLQALLVRSMVEGGEALVRFLPAPRVRGLAVPLQLRAMEGDQLDDSKHGLLGRQGDRQAVLGVSYDGDGRRAGYWLRPAHPGDVPALGQDTSVFVPASDVAHLYRVLRIGQSRGVTWFAPSLVAARDLADYLEASRVKAKIEACFAGFVKSQDVNMPATIVADKAKASPGRDLADLELSPGMMTRLEPGEDVVFAQPSSSTSFEPFVLHASMAIAAGVGITYDQLTGDLRQANYSSLRAGKIEFRAIVRQIQHHVVIRQLCRPTWSKFIDYAILAGKLRPRSEGYPVGWIAPGFEPIDPLKDLKADILAVRSGRMTWGEFVAGWGNDPQTQLEEIAAFNKEADELNLVLDTDPRKTGASGTAQQVPAGDVQQDQTQDPANA